ncbi:MAG: site-specific DNA-methyltransferase [Phycisphaerae bacterium]|nr:site-specific DNA-methyltransferase [Phycisphaerae bacterium]
MVKPPAPRNRTIQLSESERKQLSTELFGLASPQSASSLQNKIIHGDIFKVADFMPEKFVDLLIIDPPYNLDKKFNSTSFKKKSLDEYAKWFENLLTILLKTLKQTASVYICCDWFGSSAVHNVLEKHLIVRNRITWEREKGRGAKRNWKNCSEDIWFATVSADYVFNVEDVKLKRRVIAPYTDDKGKPKDWQNGSEGQFRLTHPSNLWNDITVPFWSMPENTDHPTQKPEKLMAKLILASSKPQQLILDPFIGTGSSIVTAKKLGRNFLGVEIDNDYCALAAKRLQSAEMDKTIQGYHKGIFYERNTLNSQK